MLRVEKLNYEVKDRKLLKDISFQVRKGEVLALLGSNGAGKSTLMKLLSGDQKASSGVISLHGKPLEQYAARELARCRAMLSQQQHVSLSFTVKEIVMMGRYPHFKASPTQQDIHVVGEVMELCGITDFADRVFMNLSGGEQQRVQLARVLAQVWDNPDSLLLLDEPISALDMHYQQKVLAIAKALSRRGFIVVLVVHDVNFAATYADRIVMLKNGRKLFDGTPIEVLNTKGIYTIFSVEAHVALNPRTLRPTVHMEEMSVDLHTFNSTLSEMYEKDLPLREKREALLAKNPYLEKSEQARQLDVSEVEIWALEKGRSMHYLQTNFEDLLPYLQALGKVQFYSRNQISLLKHIENYSYQTGFQSANCVENDVHDLYLSPQTWYCGILVDSEVEKSIHFFDRSGALLHGLYLTDDSHVEVFKEIGKQFLRNENNVPNFQRSSRTVANEKIANEILSANNAITMEAVKRILAACVQEKLPITVVVSNEGASQSYTGQIHNLVDQGARYYIKDEGLELKLNLRELGGIHYHANTRVDAGSQKEICFRNKEGEVVLKILCGAEEMQQHWAGLFLERNVI